ncbi:MAG: phenylalanine--tRNA ligase subunit alpha [Candidatus Westeberhardia cardiocondylae]|nr:phenylalanine--tRNA ligase subunit alpha [Candidatus Westeberhardia cardiocondylae]
MFNYTKIFKEANKAIKKSKNLYELESIRINLFGKKGFFSKKIKLMRDLPIKDRAKIGFLINKAKENIKKILVNHRIFLENNIINTKLTNEFFDISLSGRYMNLGSLHPITCVIFDIEKFFKERGFLLVNESEIENDYYNFDALNISNDHPARSTHDTFRFDEFKLLRTHTSSVQIKTMCERSPPMKIFSSGKVYRRDCDKNHTPMFHQIEGFVVDLDVNFSHLKKICYDFFSEFFKKKLKIRFRPSYFPFTEPSAEIDILNDNGNWLEILGCGMIHPNILKDAKIDPDIYSGFAFGMGVERLAMLRYKIDDLRVFFDNDLRFLKQFKS